MAKNDTKEKLLDAAESLFAREGYHNTSLRALTAEAGVNLAAVNYHFGSKEALLEAVFERRLKPLNEIRGEALGKIRERASLGESPSVEEILRAFMAPVLRFRRSSGVPRVFNALVGRAMAESDPTVRTIFAGHMRPVFNLGFDLLCEALPHHSRDLVFSRLHFAIGAMSRCMCLSEESLLLPEGVTPPCEEGELLALLLPFVTAGMEAR